MPLSDCFLQVCNTEIITSFIVNYKLWKMSQWSVDTILPRFYFQICSFNRRHKTCCILFLHGSIKVIKIQKVLGKSKSGCPFCIFKVLGPKTQRNFSIAQIFSTESFFFENSSLPVTIQWHLFMINSYSKKKKRKTSLQS